MCEIRIPDPIELMEGRIEREMDKVDAAGTYPCMYCGRRSPVEEMVCMSPMGDGPLSCGFTEDDCNVTD